VAIGRRTQHPQTGLAESLEAVRRTARLERAAAKHLGAGPLDGGRRGLDLRRRLRRARSSHDDHFVAADAHVADRNDRVLRLERAAGELVRLADAQHLVHAVENADQAGVDLVGAHDAKHRAGRPRRPVHVHPQLDQPRDDGVDLFLRRAFLHYDNHDVLLTPRAAVLIRAVPPAALHR
jgi:hypothetical protein